MRGADVWRARGAAASFLAVAVLISGPAAAFCRTTTCDPRRDQCVSDEKGCITSGVALQWPSRCLSFGTQKDGSARTHIGYRDADQTFRSVFSTWMSADCGGGQHPSFVMYDIGAPYGGIECDQPEFNDDAPNASVWMFRDDAWPYTDENATLALTTVQYEKSTGVILDADVEINSFSSDLTIGDTTVHADLASIATHEAGHFLGLSHTPIKSATMYARYSPGDRDIRTLDTDDVNGICAIYPPDRNVPACDSPLPPHGFGRYCNEDVNVKRGCAVGVPAPTREPGTSLGVYGALAALAVGLGARRRRSP